MGLEPATNKRGNNAQDQQLASVSRSHQVSGTVYRPAVAGALAKLAIRGVQHPRTNNGLVLP